MTTIFEITASHNSGISGYSLISYALARSTAYSLIDPDILDFYVGQVETTTPDVHWSIYRSFLKFDTSIIPSIATITRVALRMVCRAKPLVGHEFDIQIVEQDWSASDPIAVGNMEAVYDACLAASTSFVWADSSVSINTQYTGADMTIGYVNRSGNTYYSLRSSWDKDGTVPVKARDYIIIAKLDNATESYRPTLIVECTMPPTITGISSVTGLSSIQF